MYYYIIFNKSLCCNYFSQAALGPAALDLIRNGSTAGYPREEELHYAEVLLAVSVLSVVISAPLGAILIALTGPKLLVRSIEPRKLPIMLQVANLITLYYLL